MRAESTALALSSVLMYFLLPPRVVFYDNSCNTIGAALLRIPWLLLFVLLIVDRFHFRSYVCNSLFDADPYVCLDHMNTSSAECINARIKRSLFSMRFINGESLVTYLSIRFELLNLVAKHVEMTKQTDTEDSDITLTFNKVYCCDRQCCRLLMRP